MLSPEVSKNHFSPFWVVAEMGAAAVVARAGWRGFRRPWVVTGVALGSLCFPLHTSLGWLYWKRHGYRTTNEWAKEIIQGSKDFPNRLAGRPLQSHLEAIRRPFGLHSFWYAERNKGKQCLDRSASIMLRFAWLGFGLWLRAAGWQRLAAVVVGLSAAGFVTWPECLLASQLFGKDRYFGVEASDAESTTEILPQLATLTMKKRAVEDGR